LSGYGEDAPQQPPPYLEAESRSEGDLRRNSYRRSAYHRLSTQAVANDDGTPITETTNELLRQILAELQVIKAINEDAIAKLP